MTPRERAGRAARIAAYGSADARTPADYTPKEAIEALERERAEAKQKGVKGAKDKERGAKSPGLGR